MATMLLRSVILLLSLGLVVSDNCINSTECPVWPQEFSAPFGLYDSQPSIVNASSMFYYKYDEDGTVQAQLVDYTEQCFPLVNLENAKNAIPCQLLFIPDGIYLLQPALDIDCCKFLLSSFVGVCFSLAFHHYYLTLQPIYHMCLLCVF